MSRRSRSPVRAKSPTSPAKLKTKKSSSPIQGPSTNSNAIPSGVAVGTGAAMGYLLGRATETNKTVIVHTHHHNHEPVLETTEEGDPDCKKSYQRLQACFAERADNIALCQSTLSEWKTCVASLWTKSPQTEQETLPQREPPLRPDPVFHDH